MKRLTLFFTACCVAIVGQLVAQPQNNNNNNNNNNRQNNGANGRGYMQFSEATFELRGADAMLVYIDGYQVNNQPRNRVFVREIPSGNHQIKVRIFRRGQSRVLRTNVKLKNNLRTNYGIGIAPNGNIILNRLGSVSLQSCGQYNQNSCDGCGGNQCVSLYYHSYNNQCDGNNYGNDGFDTDNCNNWQNDNHDDNYWQTQYDSGHHNDNGQHNDHWGHDHGNNGNGGNGGNNGNNNGGGWNNGNNGNNGNGNNGNGGWNNGNNNNGNGGGNGNNNNPRVILDVADLCVRMRNASFDSDRLTLAQRAVSGNGATSQDVAMIVKQFDFESNRLEFAKFAYSYTIDKNNYFKIYDSFDYSSSSRALDKFIGK